MRQFMLPLVVLAACQDAPVADVPGELVSSSLSRNTTPNVSADDVAALTLANRTAAVALYQQVANADGNVLVSPHSIHLALAMTWAGAKGETATQMSDLFGFGSLTHASFNQLDLDLTSRQTLPDSFEGDAPIVRVLNQAFGQQGFGFESDYLDTLAEDYGAGLRLLDFSTEADASRDVINDWVSDSTEARINDLLPPGSITANTRLVLANAIWFKAAWSTPFQASSTTNDVFHTPGGDVTVPTMHGTISGLAHTGTGYVVADLPYTGNALSMTLIVPDAGTFDTFESALTVDVLDEALAGLQGADVQIDLPKFTFRSEIDVGAPYMALGVTDLFDPSSCDLSGMTTEADLFVSGIYHQTFIAVDEEGTEAAAATAVVNTDTSAPEQVSLTVDRPFLLLIRDRPTGEVLFMGRVVDPS